eukprot:gene34194-44178_t
MTGLRHNPYVGSFHHGINDVTRIERNSSSTDESYPSNLENQIMSDSKNNPLIGIFRHSPSQSSQKSLGLKGIIYSEKVNKPANMLSQLQVSKETRQQAKENFLISLRQIPSKVFSLSSRSSSDNSPLPAPADGSVENDGRPVCSICIEPYEDGDELLTLACSHCFHSECVSEWFYQGCVERDSVDPKSFNCPECRQDHFLSSDRNSNSAAQPRDISDIVEKEQENFVEKPVNIAYNSTAISSPTGPTDCDASSSEKKKQSDGETKSILSDAVEDYEIPTTAFVYIGKKIAEKEGGYDFLSDAGSEDYSHSYSVVDSPLSTPSSRTAPSGFHIAPLTIQQQQANRGQAKPKPSTFPTQTEGLDCLRESTNEEDGDDFVSVGSSSIYSDCGRPLRW